jgi:pimeloyl-ACP methyl ester carboxylesterase
MHPQDVLRLSVSLVFLAMIPAHATESPSRVTDQAITEQMYIDIGGIKQWITIRGADSNNPVVLILHGGPGAAFSPFDESTFGKWRQYFTVVHWDQRGAGRTYTKTGPSVESTMSMDRMVTDGIEVSEYLVQHLHQRKIVLFGGSWGSILGVYMVKRRPDLFYAYVGTAQVVNSTQQALAKKYSDFLATARAASDQKAISEVGALGPPPWNSLDKFFVFVKWIGAYEGKASTPFNMALANEYASEQERKDWAAAMTMSVKHFFGPTPHARRAAHAR